jgi:hypothetical protein
MKNLRRLPIAATLLLAACDAQPRPERVQIYETIMGDTEGQSAATLLAGVTYLKDNQLPPTGLDKDAAPPDIAVRGAAREDADFGGETDTTRHSIILDGTQGPLVITVELLYQSIGYQGAE